MAKYYDNVIDFLESKLTAVVSTVSSDGKPQSAVLFFWIGNVRGENFDLYFITRRHTRKARNMERNKWTSVVVGTEAAPFSVQIEGAARLVERAESVADIWNLGALTGKKARMRRLFTGEFFPLSPFSGLKGKDYGVYRVSPSFVRFMAYDKEKGEITYRDCKTRK